MKLHEDLKRSNNGQLEFKYANKICEFIFHYVRKKTRRKNNLSKS